MAVNARQSNEWRKDLKLLQSGSIEGFWEDHKANMWEKVLDEMETKNKITIKIRKKQLKYLGHIIKCNEWIKQLIHQFKHLFLKQAVPLLWRKLEMDVPFQRQLGCFSYMVNH